MLTNKQLVKKIKGMKASEIVQPMVDGLKNPKSRRTMSNVRRLNFTVAVIDDDKAEHFVRKNMNDMFAVVDSKTLPNTDHLKEDNYFKKLLKHKRTAQQNIDKYIDLKRIK